MPERPAPLVLVVAPGEGSAPSGSYSAVAETGRSLLAVELSRRLAGRGAAIAPLAPTAPPDGAFHWGRWYAAAARSALAEARGAGRAVDAIGYAGAGALALADDRQLDDLLSPLVGEVVANNRYSADALVVAAAGSRLDEVLVALEGCPSDNAAVRCLEDAGFAWRDLAGQAWSRFDVDTPLDLALLRVASRLPGTRRLDGALAGFLEVAVLPGGRALELPRLAELGGVVRNRQAELVVAGRVPSAAWSYLETETACRVRGFVEERGMRSSRGGRPRSLLADWLARSGPADLVDELARLGDAVILDTRVLMAAVGGSAAADAWPPGEERFASDFLDTERIATPWLAELTAAAAAAPVPVLLGGHALVSDGLRIVVEAAWQGR